MIRRLLRVKSRPLVLSCVLAASSLAALCVFLRRGEDDYGLPPIKRAFTVRPAEEVQTTKRFVEEAFDWNRCYHVYLDVGSNRGVQVRKLMEPHLFPSPPPMETQFTELFGGRNERNRSEICAIGFEPNESHERQLRFLTSAYHSCHFPVTFLTRTAAADRDGLVDFFSDDNLAQLEWGASIVRENTNVKSTSLSSVRAVRLSRLILDKIARRRIPRKIELNRPPRVLMKMDIEGAELEVMTDLLMSGALQHVDRTLIEWHPLSGDSIRAKAMSDLSAGLGAVGQVSEGGRPEVRSFDDETYSNDEKLPEPKWCKQ